MADINSATNNKGLTEENVDEIFSALPEGMFKDKKNLREAVGIDPSALETVYYLAYGEYEQEHYKDALRMFGILCIMDHKDARFWKGLGACALMLKDYVGAMCAFEYAANHIEDDQELRLKTAECCLRVGYNEAAKFGLERVMNMTIDASKINKRAKVLLKSVSDKLSQP